MDDLLFAGRTEEVREERGSSALSRDELLAIFDVNPVRAEEKYAELYQSLVRYFECNRHGEPQDMAQEALKRGFARLQEGQKITTLNPAGYFFGIARNLVREGWTIRAQEPLGDREQPIGTSLFYELNTNEQQVLLRECLRTLPPEELEMLMAHVEGEGEIWSRKAGLRPAALRLRIYRIRRRLERLASIHTSFQHERSSKVGSRS